MEKIKAIKSASILEMHQFVLEFILKCYVEKLIETRILVTIKSNKNK